MRIGLMCHSSVGGSGRIATSLAGELAERGHKVHLFARTTPFGGQDHASEVILHRTVSNNEDKLHPADLYTNWSTKELQTFVSLVLRVIADEGLDVLHFHYGVPFAYIAANVKDSLGDMSPVLVGTLHGSDVTVYGQHALQGPLLAQALRETDGLTTVSQNHARLAAAAFGLTVLPEVIPNFVDLSLFRPLDRANKAESEEKGKAEWTGPGGRKVRISHVSNFRPEKDLKTLARIFIGIRKKMNAELWLVGDGQEMRTVQSVLKDEGVENDVRYWGLRSKVAPIIAQTDLMVISSRLESFCMAVLEAMACGVPVLATNVGGLPEVVEDGRAGLLFPFSDYSSAVDLAVGLLSDHDRYKAMRQASVNHARKFEQKEIVSFYEDLYKKLLAGHPSNRFRFGQRHLLESGWQPQINSSSDKKEISLL